MKVLQAFIADDNGGLTKYIIRNYYYIRQYDVQYDFLTYDNQILSFENELLENGAKVFHISSPINLYSFISDIKNILNNNYYDFIHFNMSYANFVPLLFIKTFLPKRTKIIIHSHSTGFDEKNKMIQLIKFCVHKIGRRLIPVLCDGFLTCSTDAGKWMFTHKERKSEFYQIMHNAIDITSFIFNQEIRNMVRKELGFTNDDVVIGHVGRFTYQKNHEFLLEIFQRCQNKCKKYKLLLIGDGPYRENIEKKVCEYGFENYVVFLGTRKDIHRLLQAMDIFCLPSRFEGLPIVGVEAQAADLICIVSDAVSQELRIVDSCKFLSLKNKDQWVDAIVKVKHYYRNNNTEKIKNAGYEINDSVKNMYHYYKKISRKK